MKRARGLSMEHRRGLAGLVFVLPWLIGFSIFFIRPLVVSLTYSLQAFSAVSLSFVPLKDGVFANYINLFTQDTKFLPYLTQTMQTLMYQAPLVVCFSVIVGLMLKSNFRGRTFMRGIFFLPVIVTTGIVSSIFKASVLNVAQGPADAGSFFNPTLILAAMQNAGIPNSINQVISGIITNSADAVWLSGIQILIILAGVMNIPSSYYEVAGVEGGSAWVVFWKVTLPLLKPYLLVVAIYTIVDSFTSTTNVTMKYLIETVYGNYNISYGSAMFWVYFVIVFAIIGFLFLLFTRQNRKEKRMLKGGY
ncbi:MAG: sugar ABC transporter permease [Clostridiales bacterium]|nr:sugar ABC transporter permease [Clostridiales bacterium]